MDRPLQLLTRRQLIIAGAMLCASPGSRGWTRRAGQSQAIPALLPRKLDGHQFVVYADSCSGVPESARGKNLAAVNSMLRRIEPQPDFICFPGDHINGGLKDYGALR